MADPLILEVCGLAHAYEMGAEPVFVFRDLDFQLKPGELCAVMGPSGVGKSTLLNCIAGLETPTAGVIKCEGAPLPKDEDGLCLHRRRLGIVYQFFNLVEHLSVFENVALPYLIANQAPDESAVEAMLEEVGLSHRKHHRPKQLSGGEMQLTSIARALVMSPSLVLADEPTGSVNLRTGRKIMEILKRTVDRRGAALLLVTHHAEDAAMANRVEFLVDGGFAPDGGLRGEDVSKERIFEALQALGI